MVGAADNPALPQAIPDLVALIRGEFVVLKLSFKTELQEHIGEAIKPLSDKLEALSLATNSTSLNADKALELSTTAMSEIPSHRGGCCP